MDTTPESSGYYDFPGESFLSGRNALRPYKRIDDGKTSPLSMPRKE